MNTAQFTPAGTLTAEDLGAVHLIGIGGGLEPLQASGGPDEMIRREAQIQASMQVSI